MINIIKMIIFFSVILRLILYLYNCNTKKNIILSNKKYKNIIKSDEYIINNYKTIHIRTNFTKIRKAYILYLHGYAGHSNRPEHEKLINFMNNNDICVITMDFSSHGYSDNIDNNKCYIPKYEYLIDDVFNVINSLFIENDNNNFTKYKISETIIPFYLIGHSMGGGIAILIADIIMNNKYKKYYDIVNKIKYYFNGVILISPAIKLKLPNFLKYIIKPLSYLYPKSYISNKILDPNKYNEHIWINKDFINFICLDNYKINENGISYGDNIRFGTLQSIIDITNKIKKDIKEIDYPILILYDKYNDISISNDGINFIENISKKIKITHVKNGLHDPLGNKTKYILHKIYKWIKIENKT